MIESERCRRQRHRYNKTDLFIFHWSSMDEMISVMHFKLPMWLDVLNSTDSLLFRRCRSCAFNLISILANYFGIELQHLQFKSMTKTTNWYNGRNNDHRKVTRTYEFHKTSIRGKKKNVQRCGKRRRKRGSRLFKHRESEKKHTTQQPNVSSVYCACVG